MGAIHSHRPVLLIMAAFSRHEQALNWAQLRATECWGPIALTSPIFDFCETQFYERSMGPGLRKTLWAFENLIDPAQLVELKHTTNDWEEEFKLAHSLPESRPLNLDPGYLSEAKLVLATTKDRDHRIYLERGIFAEATLVYQHGAWQVRPWTYPNYRRADYHRFFDQCRRYLRGRNE